MEFTEPMFLTPTVCAMVVIPLLELATATAPFMMRGTTKLSPSDAEATAYDVVGQQVCDAASAWGIPHTWESLHCSGTARYF